jgi:hypothetical protein
MRKYIFSVVIFCGLASAQAPQYNRGFPTDNRPVTGEEWRLKLVEHLMSIPSPVTNGAVQLYGMGDEAAVDVIKILSEKPSLTPEETKANFGHRPHGVRTPRVNHRAREPKASGGLILDATLGIYHSR